MASRPSFAAEWASEFEISWNRSRADSRQFMGGSEERPVSTAWIMGARSPKHSSTVSKPEKAPNMEKWGVQMWAGTKTASGQISRVSSSRSWLEIPRIGLPSEWMFPTVSSFAAIRSAASRSGRIMRLWTFLTLPSCL